MTSHQRSSSGGYSSRGNATEKGGTREDTIKSDKIQVERKTFVFSLKENPRGRFLRITEDVGGRRDTIIVPAPGLEDFRRVLEEMIEAAEESPTPLPENQ